MASGCQLIVTLEWYKALVLEAEENGSEGDEGEDEEDEGEKPPLPQKKDGSVSALILSPSHFTTAYWVLRFTSPTCAGR